MSERGPLERLGAYISTALERPLPPAVAEKTKHHMLDTLAAMVTGSRLKPGERAISFVGSQGGLPESAVVGSNVSTTAVNAAMATGRLAPADETQQSCGVTAGLAAIIAEEDFSSLQAPIKRVAIPDVPIPFHQAEEECVSPTAEKIVAAVHEICH